MRRFAGLILALALTAPLWGGLPAGVPTAPTDPVMDLAGMMDAATAAQLNAELRRAHDAGGFQLAVLTLPSLDGQAIEEASIAVARAWGLGDKARGDGVLLVIAPKEHQLRIEVGSRLEGDLPDIACARIIREEMTPRLKAGDPNGAVLAGCSAIAAKLGVALSLPESPAPSQDGPINPILLIILVIFLVPVMLLRALGFGGRGIGGGFGGGMGGGGFGGGGGGGFSGGGGGFSGGGASGGW
jgi:uncharacterized protein